MAKHKKLTDKATDKALQSSKREMSKERYVSICPKCKSKEVTKKGAVSENSYSNNYICMTCGYQSPIFPEIPAKQADRLPDQPRHFSSFFLPIFVDSDIHLSPRKLMCIIGLILLAIALFLFLKDLLF
jgi:predicted RNA-binding Zn-ribbon protein involved in translation (DUF1610 family)